MHIRVRAPLLSAALSTVCIWIMYANPSKPSDLGGALEHRHQLPRLASRHRAAGRNRHGVTLAGRAGLVMREQARGAADVLAVTRVLQHALDLDGDRLGRLGADD